MQALIVCTSVHHGNTQQVARAMAQVLDAQLCQSNDIHPSNTADYDVIGLGSGIYFWKHHPSILHFARSLSVEDGQRLFIFSTRGGFPMWVGHRALKKILRGKGISTVDEFSCKGYDTYGLLKLFGGFNRGRPDADDLAQARRFAQDLI